MKDPFRFRARKDIILIPTINFYLKIKVFYLNAQILGLHHTMGPEKYRISGRVRVEPTRPKPDPKTRPKPDPKTSHVPIPLPSWVKTG